MYILVTLTKSGGFYNRKILEIDGLKADGKPTDMIEGVSITNGSIFREMDGDTYKFDETNHKWLLWESTSQGGGTAGADGREIELKATDTHIQWRYVGEPSWTNLVELSTLKGKSATIKVGTVQSGQNASVENSGTNTDAVLDFILPKGDKGENGLDTIKSVNINTTGNLEINTTDEKVKEVDFTVP